MAEIDPKQLEPGTQIATKSGTKLSIIKFLGEGGQGSVYEVDYGGVRKALKWYKDLGRDPEAFRKIWRKMSRRDLQAWHFCGQRMLLYGRMEPLAM